MVNRRPIVEFLTLEQRRAGQIQRILRQAASETEAEIRRVDERSLNPLTRAQLVATRQAIYARLYRSWGDIGTAVAGGRAEAAGLAAQVTMRLMKPIFSKVLPPAEVRAVLASEEARAVQTVELALRRLDSSYIPLSSRVYRNRALLSGQVDQKVNVALARGLNARQFAAEMRGYIDPSTPGGMSYAAMRLSRTELNNAFHASSVMRYQENRVVRGVDWHLSRSHPQPDECDKLQDEGPYPVDAVPAKPHPQCFCFITPELISTDELMAGLLSGGGSSFDGAPWYEISGIQSALLGFGIGYLTKSITAKEVKSAVQNLAVAGVQ